MQKNNIYSSFAVISDVMKLRKPNTLTKLVISKFSLIAKLKWLRLILKVEKYLFNFLRILPLGKFKRGKVLSNQRSHQLLSNRSASTPWNYCWTFEASWCLWISRDIFVNFLREFLLILPEKGVGKVGGPFISQRLRPTPVVNFENLATTSFFHSYL